MKSLVFAIAPVLVLAACATGNTTTSGTGGEGGDTGAGGGTAGSTTTTGPTGGTGTGGSLIGGGMTGGAPPDTPPTFYIHTNTTLYTADPSKPNLDITLVGDVECIGGAGEDTSLTDIAVSAAGDLWGISKTNVYKLEVQGSTVKCTQTIPLQNPSSIRFYGLTFAPKGVLDPNKEVLIAGNTAGELWRVDESGALSMHGTLGVVPTTDGNGHDYPYAGKKWELSGDLVFVDNNGNPAGFATVRDCPNPPSTVDCHDIDTLVELNVPKLATATTESVVKSLRGQIVKAAGCSDPNPGYGAVFGITAWKDKVFGFSRSPDNTGFTLSIENDKGTACVLGTFAEPWSGAGVTTIAQIDIPPAK